MPDLMAEVAFAVEYEQARTVADVLLRRTRIGLTSASSLDSADSVREVAALMGNATRLDEGRRRARSATPGSRRPLPRDSTPRGPAFSERASPLT